ncbi:uncharacterized protein FMAN_14146 [Fusarium mangiferae]|uniref:C2H2-type domain-containing protein n=1 Tax=Fusarium mangiferae TaxID=192010 RepID=A0A1L7ULW4_FUSMA|nr:uncharacterized protein FMAN_14146 [Fusarium mangiferae]CVL08226.1 uncharacterized protein FMAN_14146 [Fusarium mangiferae]
MDPPSPELKPARPDLNPCRSLSPDIPRSGPNGASHEISGSSMLLRLLNNGRHFEGSESACDEDLPSKESRREGAVEGNTIGGPLLQHLAAAALQATSTRKALPSLAVQVPTTIPDSSTATRRSSIHGEPPIDTQSKLRYIPSGRTPLPDKPRRRLCHRTRAPAGKPAKTLSSQSVSSPCSPPDGYQTPSPHSPLSASTNYHPTNGNHPRAPTEDSSSNAVEILNTDNSTSTSVTSTSIDSTSITDGKIIDGITHPQPLSISYPCNVTGCNVKPFENCYLLESHMNVHSSIRPHYCPVKGCPRSEGGKGFKRMNELIRHGLVHDSPGYVCPFCPDREHKYPRPDNLQRYVD